MESACVTNTWERADRNDCECLKSEYSPDVENCKQTSKEALLAPGKHSVLPPKLNQTWITGPFLGVFSLSQITELTKLAVACFFK